MYHSGSAFQTLRSKLSTPSLKCSLSIVQSKFSYPLKIEPGSASHVIWIKEPRIVGRLNLIYTLTSFEVSHTAEDLKAITLGIMIELSGATDHFKHVQIVWPARGSFLHLPDVKKSCFVQTQVLQDFL